MSANVEDSLVECMKDKQKCSRLPTVDYSHDTGYETDLSASLLETNIADSDECLNDLPAGNNDTNVDNAFEEDCRLDGSIDCDYDSYSADKEVEELLGHSLRIRDTHRLSWNSESYQQRPSAPLPGNVMRCEEVENKTNCVRINYDNPGLDFNTSKRCRHSKPLKICRLCSLYYFRPIHRDDAAEVQQSRHEDRAFAACYETGRSTFSRSTKVNLVSRQRSECTESSGFLPDVIPSIDDRPQSLPDIVALRQHYENEMGRELRRIGDEFETSFKERNARKVQTVSWNVFNCSLTFHLSGYLNTIRRILSPCPPDTMETR